jgi:4-diphosphocytidyl-2-C-methyl-D-erythritol kinase
MRIEPLPGGGVLARAPAKVNIYLEILGRRPDGYHEIDTIMQEISLCDEIEIRPAAEGGPEDLRLEVVEADGRPSSLSAGDDNLVLRAARLFFAELGRGSLAGPLAIRLRKVVPIGAGLGGGSSDGATTLLALAALTGVGAGIEVLEEMAGRLGSDVAFFVRGGTARCRGRGEKIVSLGDAFTGEPFHCVLVYPGFEVSTSLIYRELDRSEEGPLALTAHPSIANMSLESLPNALRRGALFFNRLEQVALRVFPELERLKKEIQKEPFTATLMSGSGSTIYGVTRSQREAEEIAKSLRGRIRGRVFVARFEKETTVSP